MKIALLLMTLAICISSGSISAQDSGTTPTEMVVSSASAGPQGADYVLSLRLQDGQTLALKVPQPEALKIVSGLSQPAGPDAEKRQMVTLVRSMGMQAESQGKFVILQPIGTSGPLTPLAIPLQGADAFTKQFQQKAAEVKAIAAKTQQQK